MWILESSHDATERVTFRMPPGSVKTIGRSPGAEFIVDAALVSRLHCQLTATSDLLRVKDLDSTNGTYVNGKRVRHGELHDGDRLSVGRIELIVSRQGTAAQG